MFVVGATALHPDSPFPNRLVSDLMEPMHAKILHQRLAFTNIIPCQYYWNESYYNFLGDDFNLKTFT